MRYVICDTETTGLPPCKAVEIAMTEIGEDLQVLQHWYSLIDPEIPIQSEAQAIHGISSDMLVDSPTSEEFIDHVLGGKLEGDICIIAYNVKFDLPMLTHIGNVTHTICVLEMARMLVKDTVNHKLQTIRQHFGIAENKAHSAAGDVEVTLEVLRRLLVMAGGRSLFEHANTTKKIYTHMPFGKNKGKLIMSLPVHYLDYMLGLTDLDPNLKASLQKARNIK